MIVSGPETGEFVPRIAGFVCNWGAYSGFEMAGVNRREYPSGMRIVRVACLGRIHPGLVLRAFELGADGVMLLRCPPEDCHYGSSPALVDDVLTHTRKVLGLLGVGAERLTLVEIPVGRDDILAREISGFTERIRRTGASPLRETARLSVVGSP